MRKGYVSNISSFIFYRIGCHIGRHPQWYIASFILLTGILATGMLNLTVVEDIEYLLTPINARSLVERRSIETQFPQKLSNYYFSRMLNIRGVNFVLILPKNNKSMMDETVIDDVLKLDEIIQDISIFWNSSFIRYKHLCAKMINNRCYENSAVTLKGKIEKMKKGEYLVKYPIDYKRMKVTGKEFGDVKVNKNNYIEEFSAVSLHYMLDCRTEKNNKLCTTWGEKFISTLLKTNLEHIKIYIFSDKGIAEEMNKQTKTVTMLCIKAAIPILLMFVLISNLSSNMITSKPWLGIAGIISVGMSVISAFGLLRYFGIEFVNLNMSAALLLLGVGVDDSFILINSWRRTNRDESVEKRMGEAFEDASVAITISSLTNFLSFCIGLTVPYRAIYIFSLYSAISILFDYFYQIFFFGSLMALDGYREKVGLSAIFCSPTKPSSLDNKDIENATDIKYENMIIKFFPETLAPFLHKRITKISVLFVFLMYLAGAICGMKFITTGFDFNVIYSYDSYLKNTVSVYKNYFNKYRNTVQVIVNTTLDYSDLEVQNDIEDILKRFESCPFMSNFSTTQSWLREYLSFSKNPVFNYLLEDYNLNNSSQFLEGLKNVFLKIKPANIFENDIIFNKQGEKIIASRFLLMSYDVPDYISESTLMRNLRNIADSSKYPIYIYGTQFPFLDIEINITENMLKNVGLTLVVISVVIFLFVPNILFVVCIVSTIVSVVIGVVGYMSLWNVSISCLSMILIIVVVGLSVDSVAHIAYAFLSPNESNSLDRMKIAFHIAGYPILQGFLSTFLCIMLFYFGPSEMFFIMFKILLITTIIILIHSLIFLPSALNFLDLIHIPWKFSLNL
ncbi:patched domain-containing protein 3-like [Centruroides sculpturatus]|uniref:patched domain-containing protein 3-like n=1 Tax=Centruroides sculpturatus TaxID=218467 RepID=UPI000C6DF4BD|nr:patched domain-containing protein 3-like [Centruroides sculpturatus]XP_023216932.1 patched domain-containing protein 3-like [Centruroides sculpturatus]